jgi:hypothetical protein
VAVYSNGGRHCFSADCDYHVNGETGEETEVSTPSNLNMGGVVAEIPERSLSAKTTSSIRSRWSTMLTVRSLGTTTRTTT